MNPYSREKLYLFRRMGTIHSKKELKRILAQTRIDDINNGHAQGFLRAFLRDTEKSIDEDKNGFIRHWEKVYDKKDDIFCIDEEVFIEEEFNEYAEWE